MFSSFSGLNCHFRMSSVWRAKNHGVNVVSLQDILVTVLIVAVVFLCEFFGLLLGSCVASGVYAISAAVFTIPRGTYMNVFGTRMNLFLVEKLGLTSQKLGSDSREMIDYVEADPIQREQEDFAHAISEKRKPEVDGYEGMANIAVIEAAIKSSNEKRPVQIKEVMN